MLHLSKAFGYVLPVSKTFEHDLIQNQWANLYSGGKIQTEIYFNCGKNIVHNISPEF